MPTSTILNSYLATLTENGVAIDGGAFSRMMAASELRTRLLQWPAYLRDAPSHTITGLLSRIGYLSVLLSL